MRDFTSTSGSSGIVGNYLIARGLFIQKTTCGVVQIRACMAQISARVASINSSSDRSLLRGVNEAALFSLVPDVLHALNHFSRGQTSFS